MIFLLSCWILIFTCQQIEKVEYVIFLFVSFCTEKVFEQYLNLFKKCSFSNGPSLVFRKVDKKLKIYTKLIESRNNSNNENHCPEVHILDISI